MLAILEGVIKLFTNFISHDENWEFRKNSKEHDSRDKKNDNYLNP